MKIKNIKVEYDLYSANLIITTDDKYEIARIFENAETIDPEKEYTVKIEKKKQKRSLDANAYMWVLLGKLAPLLYTTPVELYQHYVREVGQYYVIPVKEDAIEPFTRIWESKGTGWFVDDIGRCRRTEGYHNLKAFYGSSEYDTWAMSRLIDEVVQDCREQGIETLSPDELAKMKGEL